MIKKLSVSVILFSLTTATFTNVQADTKFLGFDIPTPKKMSRFLKEVPAKSKKIYEKEKRDFMDLVTGNTCRRVCSQNCVSNIVNNDISAAERGNFNPATATIAQIYELYQKYGKKNAKGEVEVAQGGVVEEAGSLNEFAAVYYAFCGIDFKQLANDATCAVCVNIRPDLSILGVYDSVAHMTAKKGNAGYKITVNNQTGSQISYTVKASGINVVEGPYNWNTGSSLYVKKNKVLSFKSNKTYRRKGYSMGSTAESSVKITRSGKITCRLGAVGNIKCSY